MLSTLPSSPFTPIHPSISCSPISPGLPQFQTTHPHPPSLPFQPLLHPQTPTFHTVHNHTPPLLPLPTTAPKNAAAPLLHPLTPTFHTVHKHTPPLLPLPAPKNTAAPLSSLTSTPNHQNPQIPTPKPQQFSKWNRKQIANITENQHVTNLYIQNLPLQWSAVELHFILSKFGEVIDVFIPSKRAKNGKRFGFVRYRACRDIQRLISSINLIKVANDSLQALIARGRDHLRQNHTSSKTPKTLTQPPSSFEKSFADTLKNVTPPCPKASYDKANISFPTFKSDIEWLSSCVFGVLSEPIETRCTSILPKAWINPVTSKSPSSHPSINHLSSSAAAVAAMPSSPQNSDPFKLMPIIKNINHPMNDRACSHILTSQNIHATASGKASSSCRHLNSNVSVGPSLTANICHSPHNSSTNSSSPNTHASHTTFSNSNSRLSSLCPVISFNNSDPLPFTSKTHNPIKQAQSLPSIHLSDFPSPAKPNLSFNNHLGPTPSLRTPHPTSSPSSSSTHNNLCHSSPTHSPPHSHPSPNSTSPSTQNKPNSFSSYSSRSLDSSLSPNTRSNLTLYNLEQAV
ncbi:hypothetical protein Tsubulata_000314 [Turnera subulata]|uniref:RRM domain-containing protein n=1 Tax=Turnera subulata TaxID=218843 RepID=A0A9Q0F1P2_9ROSI|nr:hypothetical protein Tsubulata_000314 [Turnera subulata]